ncbi:activating signal cointegrator 1 complex subunit 2 [Nesidiocoris tenuis]|uniref:Activating signal cointegrator 1 complex subunit 2 n=1 Tax=Nesidiocoris tenuis TaxID=355587 RepID=A0ABN7A5P9_9HEMI|nr:activating signal cointegrator 1 complex subunit 2 [Nesidiocoris tenuis]
MSTLNNKSLYKPLETLTIKINGESVPALSSYFVQPRPSVAFSTPPRPNRNGQFVMGVKDSWLHNMETYKSNLEWLLGLSHHEFWSQIVYGSDTWDSVISFLQEGYPFYSIDHLPDDEHITLVYSQIYYLVFNVFKRAMTRKESEVNFIGKKYGSLLYNYTIISVPMMIDICAMYGHRFHDELTEMIASVFMAQPLYAKDLESSIQTIKTAFSLVQEKFTGQPIVAGEITKLSDAPRVAKLLSVSELQDVVFYILDIAASLATFVDVFEAAALVLHSHKFEIYIASLYEHAIPSAVQQIQACSDNNETIYLYFTLMFKMNNARFFFIKLFRLCVQASLNSMFSKSQEVPDSQAYFDVVTECLGCPIFMRDYHAKYPIDHDLDAIASNCPEFDNIKYNFLLESLTACLNKPTKSGDSSHKIASNSKPNNTDSSSASQGEAPPKASVPVGTSGDTDGIFSKIFEVRDCLPHLGDGFIFKCLEHYNMSPSVVINAILEDTLPENLKKLDHELPYIPPEEEHTPIGRIYNSEEYDEMCHDLSLKYTAHEGKKRRHEGDLMDLLNDKSFYKECESRFAQLGIIESLDDVYDDEYDDTYDDGEPPVPEVEEPDRKFVLPRVLQQARRKDEKYESGSELSSAEEENPESNQQRSLNFCENPEDVRERYQQKRLATMKRPPPPPSRRDVVGNPKGQGQDKEVLRNRQQKTVHKNANRKKAAAFKKSKGLF